MYLSEEGVDFSRDGLPIEADGRIELNELENSGIISEDAVVSSAVCFGHVPGFALRLGFSDRSSLAILPLSESFVRKADQEATTVDDGIPPEFMAGDVGTVMLCDPEFSPLTTLMGVNASGMTIQFPVQTANLELA